MQREKRNYKRVPYILAALFLFVFALLFSMPKAQFSVSAEEVQDHKGILQTDIEEDLKDLNKLQYIYNPYGTHQVVRFTEIFYAEDPEDYQWYALYLYVYNPKLKKLEENGNVANMAVAYNSEGEPSEYENVALTYCDHTNSRLFYKFKVNATSAKKILAVARAYEKEFGKRRYDITGVQLMYPDGTLDDAAHGRTYFYTGYGKGLGKGADEESTLACQTVHLDTIELDVQSAYKRMGAHTGMGVYAGDEHQSQLNTVYFSVPEEYFADYGALQKIKAEWYEYKTRPIYVTSDIDAYRGLVPYVGVDIGKEDKGIPWRVWWEEGVTSVFNDPITFMTHRVHIIKATYNDKGGYKLESSLFDDGAIFSHWNIMATHQQTRMDWLFFRDNVETRQDYGVSAAEIVEYMEKYSSRYSYKDVVGRYTSDLFTEVDLHRQHLFDNETKNGYICMEFDAGEKMDILVKNTKEPWWFWEKLGIGYDYAVESQIEPIIVLDAQSMNGVNAEQFARLYNISEKDKNAVWAYCKKQIDEGKRPVLFNFAVTDYYSSTARFDKVSDPGESGFWVSSQDGYVAQETMFLNFDVISLSFRADKGTEKVIGVVSDPIDLIGDLEAPSDLDPEKEERKEEIKRIIIAIIILIIGLLLIIGVIVGIVYLSIYAPGVLYSVGSYMALIADAVKNAFNAMFSTHKKKNKVEKSSEMQKSQKIEESAKKQESKTLPRKNKNIRKKEEAKNMKKERKTTKRSTGKKMARKTQGKVKVRPSRGKVRKQKRNVSIKSKKK